MMTEVSAECLRQNLDELLQQVQCGQGSVLVRQDGKAVAALIDAGLFARIRRMQERFDALSRRISDAYAEVPEGEGMAELAQAAAAARQDLQTRP